MCAPRDAPELAELGGQHLWVRVEPGPRTLEQCHALLPVGWHGDPQGCIELVRSVINL